MGPGGFGGPRAGQKPVAAHKPKNTSHALKRL